MKINREGYILILTFFFIAISVVLLSSVLKQSINFQKNAGLMLNKERARLLALSGIELALDQISFVAEPESEKSDNETSKKPAPKQDIKKWLSKLFPIVNRWQVINLNMPQFSFTGSINFLIASEQGKIELNNFARILEKEVKQTAQTAKFISEEGKTEILSSQSMPSKSFTSVINDLLNKEAKVDLINALNKSKSLGMLEDPTQLLKFKSFESLKDNIFLQLDSQSKKFSLSLTDLFTTSSGSGKLNPWFLSRSIAKILGLQIKQEAKNSEAVNQFKPRMNWEQEWDKVLAPVYGKSFSAIPKEVSYMFAPEFEATAFSVVVYAKVGSITQRLYAIFERKSSQDKNIAFKITRIFWF